ncbi:hypothetical protein PT7_3246 [Pusillimonas sp. T7-7]|uniref:alpha/beta fold hydrolase n=1 Tax=Pusillimonas sp. (strain T7-7) TaxID=1007105 RepID=UPI0002084E50|nr:alpha/beta fold hydrolase [Pusillimonas sp. T7-7]AEC21786.1 hypothetical protein PT7_3246 [Pusillimonas sp. T7-7]
MPFAAVNGVELYYEEAGAGEPILFIHELAGDFRSWEPQLRAFSRHYRCITYSARGYLPSSVPADPAVYSQQQAAADALGLLDHLGVDRAHIVGLSMGGFASLQFGIDFPDRVLSLTVASCGSGAEPAVYKEKQAGFLRLAQQIREQGMDAFTEICNGDSTRNSFLRKDPRGWSEFITQLASHSAQGTALTLQCVQGGRPSLWAYEDKLAAIAAPTLIVAGDRDTPVLQPSLFLAQIIPQASLAVMPDSGHVLNLEEPDLFNQLLRRFLSGMR